MAWSSSHTIATTFPGKLTAGRVVANTIGTVPVFSPAQADPIGFVSRLWVFGAELHADIEWQDHETAEAWAGTRRWNLECYPSGNARRLYAFRELDRLEVPANPDGTVGSCTLGQGDDLEARAKAAGWWRYGAGGRGPDAGQWVCLDGGCPEGKKHDVCWMHSDRGWMCSPCLRAHLDAQDWTHVDPEVDATMDMRPPQRRGIPTDAITYQGTSVEVIGVDPAVGPSEPAFMASEPDGTIRPATPAEASAYVGVAEATVDGPSVGVTNGATDFALPLTTCATCGQEFGHVRVGVCLPGVRRCQDCAPLPEPRRRESSASIMARRDGWRGLA